MTASCVIEIENLTFSYNGNPVLKNVDLTVPPNDFLALIGPNGGGKTTLLRLILGLLKPDRGTLRVFGEKPNRTVHRIGYVPQFVHINLSFPITVAQVVLMGRLRTGRGWISFHNKSDRKDAEKALDQMGMLQYGDHKMEALSGGQRQRVIVARALVSEPDLLILDEPTANMDADGQTDLYNLLKECNRHMTIVVATHDLMVMSSFVKSVACINQSLMHHQGMEVTQDMLDMAYHCPVELVAHGMPHRVLCLHDHGPEGGDQRPDIKQKSRRSEKRRT